ncbi:retroviral-like aspartic protease family protein [Anaerolineales bacterium HSG24]|nr:retroviral-like aspartic protease family protein [Anaerolineales bacterium HSG24]
MKFSYDTSYFPPAPTIEIWLSAPDESTAQGPLMAFIDTGADLSLIPMAYLKPLQTQIDDYRYLRSQWGEHRMVAIYSLDIRIGQLKFPAIEVVGDELEDEIILGRNLLNKLVMMLHGPQQMLTLSES